MASKINFTKNKKKSTYKSLYISEDLLNKIHKVAYENNTNFNNVVIRILEHFFENENL